MTREKLRGVFELQLFDPALITDEILGERLEIARAAAEEGADVDAVPYLAPLLARAELPRLRAAGAWTISSARRRRATIARSLQAARGDAARRECGHWVMVEKEALFNRLCIDFLRESRRRRMTPAETDALRRRALRGAARAATVPPLTTREPAITIDDAYRISRRLLDAPRRRRRAHHRQEDRRHRQGRAAHARRAPARLRLAHRPHAISTTATQLPIGARADPAARRGRDRLLARARSARPGRHRRRTSLAATDVRHALLRDRRLAHQRLEDPHPGHHRRQRLAPASSSSAQEAGIRSGVDFVACGMVVEKNGEIVCHRRRRGGAGLAARLRGVAGQHAGRASASPLRAGEVILSGSLVPLEPVVPGDRMRVRVGGIGSAEVGFT